ncbi:EpsI family protein [Duganella sp. FT134W]|uniref:EpsI family protein n=1 Tax=Duganella margarita TaxID=2692170 RepID=A0A7X4H3G8_9BURK|nr:exosortase-associated protein EpsI, B-type [Duganella margarita]MYM74150.1 EpsI family protein [Duganella margarita]
MKLSKPLALSIVISVLMAGSSVVAWAVKPRHTMEQTTPLEANVPLEFGGWKALPTGYQQMALSVAPDGQRTEEQPYDQVVMRTYRNAEGAIVMLALAYAKQQQQELKIHRPEICYQAQGYHASSKVDLDIPQVSGPAIPAQRFFMSSSNRREAVSYWIRIGDDYPRSGTGARLSILEHGLHGKVPDAILVRVSTIVPGAEEAPAAYALQERFIADLVHAMPASAARLLVAAAP